jgi:hypothetical protein
MTTGVQPVTLSNGMPWTGWIITALVLLFLTFDGATKLLRIAPVVKAFEQLGLPPNTIIGIGLVLLACTTIYTIPTTAILGAILLTGYLGGAAAIHVRAGSGAFPVAFSIAMGVLVWVGLVLREPRLIGTILLRR